jgi:hypothetical protein
MRAADDSVAYHDGTNSLAFQEFEDLVANPGVHPHIDIIAEESLHRGYFGILSRNDPYGDLAGARIVGTIECDRGDGIAAKTFASFLVER